MVKAAAAVVQGPELDTFIHWLVFDSTILHAWSAPNDEGIRTCYWCNVRATMGVPPSACPAIPPFSTSMRAAILLMAEMDVVLRQAPRGGWTAICHGERSTSAVAADSAPLAICRAALESIN